MKIRIGSEDYTIKFTEETADTVGSHSYYDKCIKISKTHNHNHEDTLLHEILHAISDIYDVRLSEKDIKILASSITDTYERAGTPLSLCTKAMEGSEKHKGTNKSRSKVKTKD